VRGASLRISPHAGSGPLSSVTPRGPGLFSWIAPTYLAANTAGMAKKPEPPPELMGWSVYKIAKKAAWLGIVEAPDEQTAIEKAAGEFKVPAVASHGSARFGSRWPTSA
jgi:hypothetical protein